MTEISPPPSSGVSPPPSSGVSPPPSSDTSPRPSSVPAPAPPAPVVRRRRTSAVRNAIEWVVVVVGAVLVALLVKTFLVQPFLIPSESMVPTLEVGDRVLVNKLSYRLHDVNRGDVVVFRRPDALAAAPGQPQDLIKRVIGLPGDTVQSRDGKVFVNGRELAEPYLRPGTVTDNLATPVKVPEGSVLVLGDNRGNSQDGRVFGPIPEDSIIGRAFVVVWPLSRFSGL